MGTNAVTPTEAAAVEPNFDQSTWTGEQYDHWNSTGEIPASKPAESTPAPPAGAPSGAESAAASATASTEAHPKGKGAEERKAQLAREIQDLLESRKATQQELAEFEAYRKNKGAPAASPTATPTEAKKPTRPVFGEAGHDQETYEQYEQRIDAHQEAVAELKAKEILKADREEREKERKEAETAAENSKIQAAWEERKEAAIAALKVTPEAFAEVAFSEKTPISTAMDGFILDSDHGPQILYYLGQHNEEAVQIAAMTPYRAVAALAKIELSFATEAPTGKAPVVPITRAAKPTTDIRATSAPPVDPLKAAIEADDYATYEALANSRDAERRRKG